MIRNIVFDIGRVLLHFEPLRYLEEKINDKELAEKVYEAVFLSKEWVMLDEGTISEEDAFSAIRSRHSDISGDIKKSMEDWYSLMIPIDETVKLQAKLKAAGCRTYLLSNFHEKAFGIITERYKFFSNFDGGVISYREKLLKPQPEIYRLLLKRYSLSADETLFIDDIKANIEGAAKVGIDGIIFTGYDDLVRALAEKGIVY